MSLTISSVVTQPIIPQPQSSSFMAQSVASSSSTSEDSVSSGTNIHNDLQHAISVTQTATAFSDVNRTKLYSRLPPLTTFISTYAISVLAEIEENPHSEHSLRDVCNATICFAGDEMVLAALARCIGATPAGIAFVAADLIGAPLKESLPSCEEIGREFLASRNPFEVEAAEGLGQLKIIAEILTLPRTAVHVISKLAQNGFNRLFGSTPQRSTISSSSSPSSSSSVSSLSSMTALPETDETISLGKLQEHDWEIIRLKIVHEIVEGSSLVPPELESVASSTLSSLSISSDLEESADQLPEKDSSELPERESSRENKQSESSSIKWTGVQVHVPLDNIKKIRISTGVQFGPDGGYQTGVSTTLRHPVKDLQVTVSAEMAPDVRFGVSTSVRHPVKDAHAHVSSSSGLGISTSFRHPVKDAQVHVPVAPLTVVSVPLRHPKEARIGVGIPGTPVSVSVPVKKVINAPVKVVNKIAKKVFGRHKHRG